MCCNGQQVQALTILASLLFHPESGEYIHVWNHTEKGDLLRSSCIHHTRQAVRRSVHHRAHIMIRIDKIDDGLLHLRVHPSGEKKRLLYELIIM